jgi:hypothetical protein
MKTILPSVVSLVDAFSIVVAKISTADGDKYNAMISFIIDQDDDEEEILDLPLITNIFCDTIQEAIINAYIVGTAFSQNTNDKCFILDEDGNTIDTISVQFVLDSLSPPTHVH